eukprot:TRINITY_DN2541_c0_g1_i1.p1 TRINITY_DN2541_c0_g1~~TRINITY_DN2541_c0_g1_i1.p1  ORF type:complete len:405 (-),score=127.01 TRINITY_DN2541_c0_g1_i1:126-1253(-)
MSDFPNVLWSQTKQLVRVRIPCPKSNSPPEVRIQAQYLYFRVQPLTGLPLEANISLAQEVVPNQSSWKVQGAFVDISLFKSQAQEWTRLSEMRHPKIKTDWDRYEVEEEPELNTSAKAKEDLAFSQRNLAEMEQKLAELQNWSPLDGFRQVYLFLYNIMFACGWAFVFVQVALGLQELGLDAYAKVTHEQVGHVVKLLQIAALSEIVHNVIGVVPGGVLGAIALHAGRNMVLFGAIDMIPEVSTDRCVVGIYAGWSFAEVIRYAFYALNTYQVCPYLLKWARYSAFVVIFPVVTAMELYVLYLGLPFMDQRNMFSTPPMPNAYNFALHGPSFVRFWIGLVSLAGGPALYWYMLSQRSSQLRGKSKDKSKAKAKSS